MRIIFSILKLELKSLYFSPIPWVIVAIFSVHSGYIFTELLKETVSQQELFGGAMDITYSIFSSSQGLFNQLIQVLFLYVPLITMGIFSKEYSQGTYKVLFSSPIKLRDIIIGKFFSLLSFFAVLLLALFPVFITAMLKIPHLDLGLLASGVLGLFILFVLYASVGLFVSSMTRYSVLSAVVTLAILYLFREIGDIGKYSVYFRDIAFNLAVVDRTDSIIDGLICSNDILYFILVSFSFLCLAFLQLYNVQKQPKISSRFVMYLSFVAGVILVLKIIEIPYFIKCYDATANKQNTLSKQSVAILNKIDEPVQITTYVNMADYLNWVAVPSEINTDKKRFRKHLRFKPDILMNYVYYEAEPLRNSDYNSPNRMPTSSIARVFCESYRMEYSDLKPFWKINNVNFELENNSIFRILETESGRKTSVLRIYDDMMMHPKENEISLAFKALLEDKTNIGFVTSSTDRTLSVSQEIGYGSVLVQKGNRYAAINQGFNVTKLNLDSLVCIPKDIDIVFVSDFVSSKFSEQSYNLIKDYINDGKNCMFFLGDKNSSRQDRLLDLVGIETKPEMILFPQKIIDTKVIPCIATSQVSSTSKMGVAGQCVILPEAKSLTYNLGTSFESFPLLTTYDNKCISIDNKNLSYDITKRIKTWKNYTPALGMERNYKENKQRIVVVSNADFISNKELNTNREGFNSDNETFFVSLLHWLSGGTTPLDITSIKGRDVFVSLTAKELKGLEFWIIYPFAIIYLLGGSILLIRRNRN